MDKDNKRDSKCGQAGTQYVTTLNQRGRTSNELNEYSRAFIDFIDPNSGPVLDLGAAYGVATIPALLKGVTVYANDIDPRHLAILRARTPEAARLRLHTIVGRFPDEVEFPESFFGAVHAANLLNFLRGSEIVSGLSKIYGWLRPGGKLFTISGTPYAGNIRRFITVYHQRRTAGERWPGECEDLQSYSLHPTVRELPPFLHLLDDVVLGRAVEGTGFVVERAEMFLRKNLPEYLKYDGRENVG